MWLRTLASDNGFGTIGDVGASYYNSPIYTFAVFHTTREGHSSPHRYWMRDIATELLVSVVMYCGNNNAHGASYGITNVDIAVILQYM